MDRHVHRSESQLIEWAEKAEKKGQPVFGVKGKSALTKHINVLEQCPVDYMHAVLEGVIKKLMSSFWFNTSHHTSQFYLIDNRLNRIKPPHDFRSTPRPNYLKILEGK